MSHVCLPSVSSGKSWLNVRVIASNSSDVAKALMERRTGESHSIDDICLSWFRIRLAAGVVQTWSRSRQQCSVLRVAAIAKKIQLRLCYQLFIFFIDTVELIYVNRARTRSTWFVACSDDDNFHVLSLSPSIECGIVCGCAMRERSDASSGAHAVEIVCECVLCIIII